MWWLITRNHASRDGRHHITVTSSLYAGLMDGGQRVISDVVEALLLRAKAAEDESRFEDAACHFNDALALCLGADMKGLVVNCFSAFAAYRSRRGDSSQAYNLLRLAEAFARRESGGFRNVDDTGSNLYPPY